MIRRVLVAVLVWGMCFAGAAEAADVPFSNLMKKPRVAQSSTVKKLNLKAKAKVVSVVVRKPKPASVATPMVDKPVDPVEQTVAAKQPGSPEVSPQEIDLSWVLDPLVATADGSKREGSASVQGNLIVVEPGYVTSPYMVIELSGHIIKTPGTTVRLDLNIGGTHRSLNWKLDDVQSGRFKVALNAPRKTSRGSPWSRWKKFQCVLARSACWPHNRKSQPPANGQLAETKNHRNLSERLEGLTREQAPTAIFLLPHLNDAEQEILVFALEEDVGIKCMTGNGEITRNANAVIIQLDGVKHFHLVYHSLDEFNLGLDNAIGVAKGHVVGRHFQQACAIAIHHGLAIFFNCSKHITGRIGHCRSAAYSACNSHNRCQCTAPSQVTSVHRAKSFQITRAVIGPDRLNSGKLWADHESATELMGDTRKIF
jgi:hypothetical protein